MFEMVDACNKVKKSFSNYWNDLFGVVLLHSNHRHIITPSQQLICINLTHCMQPKVVLTLVPPMSTSISSSFSWRCMGFENLPLFYKFSNMIYAVFILFIISQFYSPLSPYQFQLLMRFGLVCRIFWEFLHLCGSVIILQAFYATLCYCL